MHGHLLDLATRTAHAAGRFLMDERPTELRIDTKSSPTDAVTMMDRGSERIIVDAILTERPDDSILGEEGAERHGSTDVRWVIDPLDGTVNYLYQLPHWAVSIGVEIDGEPAVGVVHVPRLEQTYWAILGEGAFLDERGSRRRLQVNSVTDVSQALIGTGFSYVQQVRTEQGPIVAEVVPLVRDIRRLGAGAIDLCLVADGRIDGYFERQLQPWDLCAGGLIAREAGASVTGLAGQPAGPAMVVAANPELASQLIEVIER